MPERGATDLTEDRSRASGTGFATAGMRAALLPEAMAAAEIGGSWRQLEMVGVLGGGRSSGSWGRRACCVGWPGASPGRAWRPAGRAPGDDERDGLQPDRDAARSGRSSRRELAEALGVHYQMVGYLERGEYSPSLYLALRIVEYFEVSVEVVFSIEPFPRLGSQAV